MGEHLGLESDWLGSEIAETSGRIRQRDQDWGPCLPPAWHIAIEWIIHYAAFSPPLVLVNQIPGFAFNCCPLAACSITDMVPDLDIVPLLDSLGNIPIHEGAGRAALLTPRTAPVPCLPHSAERRRMPIPGCRRGNLCSQLRAD